MVDKFPILQKRRNGKAPNPQGDKVPNLQNHQPPGWGDGWASTEGQGDRLVGLRDLQESGWASTRAPRCDPYSLCKYWLGHEIGSWVGKFGEVVTWLHQDEGGLYLCQT